MARKIEELAPENYTGALEMRKKDLERMIKLKKAIIARSNLPPEPGRIRIVRHYDKLQFYHITQKGDTIGKYLPREKDDFATALIKLDYEKKSLAAMQLEQRLIKKIIFFNKKHSVEALFRRFSNDRKSLVSPVTLPDQDFVLQWQSVSYEGKPFDYSATEYFTAKGERVRSKSEVIIADTLNRLHIPYRYEFPLELKGLNYPIYPDFCCLNLKNRQNFYWEHFGMMDNPEYASKSIAKMQSLAESGITAGKNAIFTFETTHSPLNTKTVEKVVEQFLS